MKRNIKRLRRAGRDDLADQAQARVDEYEREAQQWRQDTYARKLPIIHADGNVEE